MQLIRLLIIVKSMYEINISNDDKLRAVLARLGAVISPALLLPAIGEEVLNNHRARHQKSQALVVSDKLFKAGLDKKDYK